MISTHVLDTARGHPAVGVPITLEVVEADGAARQVARAHTDADGRVRELVPSGSSLGAGRYRVRFDTGTYFGALGASAFYPEVTVDFAIADGSQHYHVPLLLSPYGYSTYRGS